MRKYNQKLRLAFVFVAIMLFLPIKINAQQLADLYKKNKVILEEVTGYANKNNWDQLFTDVDKEENGLKIGQLKSIAVAPDGSVFMCHKTFYEIWKFDKDGNFIKKFGSKGSKPGQFNAHFGLNCTIDGKYIFTYDIQGSMSVFDSNGNFVKKLKIDYLPLEIVPLKNSKIAILGFVVGKSFKDAISVKDINSGKEKIIWSQISEDLDKSNIVVKTGGGMMSMSLPYCHSSYTRARLGTSKNGNLLIGLPGEGIISEYSPEGVKLNSFKLNITPLNITDEDLEENYKLFIKRTDDFEKRLNKNPRLSEEQKKESLESFKSQLSKVKDVNSYPKNLPYFSSLIIDSDGNILVFEFTKEEETNKFKAYAFDASGKELGSSSFESADYKLSFISSTFCFKNGSIYAVATKENGGKTPLRLVKFNCSSK